MIGNDMTDKRDNKGDEDDEKSESSRPKIQQDPRDKKFKRRGVEKKG